MRECDDTIDLCVMATTSPDAGDSPEAEAARITQARALREQAGKGGLCFETYLPPDLAAWLQPYGEKRHDRG